MLRELWTLVQMLFATKPSEFMYKDLSIITMRHFPFKGYRFLSWCGIIITREEKKAVINRFLSTKAGKESIIHERGHCVQAISEHGDNWLRYYLNYFWHWLKHNPLVAPSSACYYVNRYEVECYAKQHDKDYFNILYYTRENLRGKYSIKGAKKLYKELGGKSSTWRAYVKSI